MVAARTFATMEGDMRMRVGWGIALCQFSIWWSAMAAWCGAQPAPDVGISSVRNVSGQWPRVALNGRLASRYFGNAQYLLDLHAKRQSFMIDAYRLREHRKKEADWDGEYAGKWLDAAARVAANTGHAAMKEKALRLAAALRECQQPDGYLGIFGPSERGKAAWDVWNQWYAMTGLTSCAERLNDVEASRAAVRAGQWLIRTYEPVDRSNHRFFQSAWGGGCNVDVCDQLVRLHAYGREARFLDFVRGVRQHYPPIQQMRRTGTAWQTHAYVLTGYLGAMAMLADTERNGAELSWIETVWRDLCAHHLYPTGSLGLKESLSGDAPSDLPNADHQETCATVEWMILCHRLHRATGKPCYADAIEKTVYNALLAAQTPDGKAWTYFTPLRYEKRPFHGPTACCYWSGPRGIAMLPELVYAVTPGQIQVDLFEPSETVVKLEGVAVRVVQTGNYPAAGRILVVVHPERPLEFTLSLRVPDWSRHAEVKVNGQGVSLRSSPGEYCRIRRRWASDDRIEMTLAIPVAVRPLRDCGVVVIRGPEVLAVDSRDNPRVDLDKINIPSGVCLNAVPSEESRRRYVGRVRHDGRIADVVFTPYADAGNGGRYRTVFPPSP
jgi:DUF1680 family protein